MHLDTQEMSVRDLLATYSQILHELRERGVVRTANNPVGDYAEYLVAAALGLALSPNSSSGCDAVGPDGLRYEIKSRRLAIGSRPSRFSAIRQLEAAHFDYLIAVVFEDDFAVSRAVKIPRVAVQRLCFWQQHVNGWILPAHDSVWNDAEVIDVTKMLKSAQTT